MEPKCQEYRFQCKLQTVEFHFFHLSELLTSLGKAYPFSKTPIEKEDIYFQPFQSLGDVGIANPA